MNKLPAKPFYTADCSIEDIGVDPLPKGKVESWALGRAMLVSGEVELHFNWVAQGGDSAQTAYVFEVRLDEDEPDYVLEGLDGLSDSEREDLIQQILASTPWQAEVLECLPKNVQELAALQ